MRAKRRNLFIAACLVPALFIFCIFVVYPVINAFVMAFYSWSGLSAGTEVFIGFDNFVTMFTDDIFWTALKNNIILMLIVPVITMFFSMLFAFILTKRNLRETSFFKIVFFFPNVLSMVAISVLWSFIYNPTMGILNSGLQAIGLGGWVHQWLGDPTTALPAIAATMIWTNIGWYMVLYIAAMQRIPVELYEAAKIDGAGEFKQFTKITFPLIADITRITIIFFITNVFNSSFTYVQLMTNGGPDHASEVLSSYMYSQAFSSNCNMGYATSIALVTFLIVLLLSLLSNRLTKTEQIQY